MLYAQLNKDDICIGISELSGKMPEYNYITEKNYNPITGLTESNEVFTSRLIEIPVYSDNYKGLKYNDGNWEVVEIVEPPVE